MLVLWLVLITSALFWWSRRQRRSLDDPPVYPGALPLIGHLHLVLGDNTKFWRNFKKLSKHSGETGGVTLLLFGTQKEYLIADPDEALILSNSALEKHFIYDYSKQWLGDGLITSSALIWKPHRKMLNPAFSMHVLYGYMPVFNRQARCLVKKLEEYAGRGPFDFLPLASQTALETICITTMESDFGGNTGNKYMEAVDEILAALFERFQKVWFHFDFIFHWSKLKTTQEKCIKILHEELTKVLQRLSEVERNSKFDKNKIVEKDRKIDAKSRTFLEILLELSGRHGVLSNEQLRNHIDTIIVSGYDTVATAMVFTTILIGSYPQVQKRLIEELEEVFGDRNVDVTRNELSRLTYLEAVIKESLRIYPVAPAFARKLDTDVKLKNYTLRKGIGCLFSLYGIQRHPIWGADADEFKPERWLDPSKLPDNANAFAPFGLGRRQCIGKTYAMMSLKTCLVHFLRHYKVKGDHRKMVLKMDILLKPQSGHEISINKRKY